ncbi:MAG: protease modulator HflC [Burkholderiaceae bacterium]
MNRLLAVIVALVVAGLLARMMLFQVDERESAVVFSLGEIRRVIREPGLYVKWPPPIQNVRYFDKRTLTLDGADIDRFITSEKQNIQIDSYVKWRIVDPRLYFISVGGNDLIAQDRISRQMRAVLNNAIALMTVDDVISGKRDELVVSVRRSVADELIKIGVEIVDVRLKRVDFAPEVAERVYDRMQSERKRVANDLRANGSAEQERIRADADRQRETIVADAYKDAQTLRGAGDAKASRAYADAYGKNPDFASFYRSLEAYRASFSDRNDLMVVDPSSEFFRHFRGPVSGGGAAAVRGSSAEAARPRP